MFSTIHRQPSVNPRPNEEPFVALPDDNLGLLGASTGGSTLEANHAYDQIEAPPSWIQTDVQSTSSSREASATDFVHPRGTGGRFIVQSFTMGHRNRTVNRRTRPVCPNCEKDFGRVQELNRHLKEKHTARRRCPFCNFRWVRPDGIKSHVVARHAEKFDTEILEEIKGLRGQRIIEFIDAYDHGLDIEPRGNAAVASSSSPAPLPAVRALQPFHHTPDTTGVFW